MQKLYLVKLFEQGKNPWEWVLGRGCLQQPVLCTIYQVLHRDFGHDQNRTWKFNPVQSFGQPLPDP